MRRKQRLLANVQQMYESRCIKASLSQFSCQPQFTLRINIKTETLQVLEQKRKIQQKQFAFDRQIILPFRNSLGLLAFRTSSSPGSERSLSSSRSNDRALSSSVFLSLSGTTERERQQERNRKEYRNPFRHSQNTPNFLK